LSDSEGHPFRGRLKGIWGSFKKRKPDVAPTSKQPNCAKNNGSLYNCFGDYVSGQSAMKANEEITSGLNSLAISSNLPVSYQTPGSPPLKQQSESGSSLSR